ncbi:MAG: ATPase [Bacilli bacterium]|nr:ATPase [Bacilli bacterium]
MKKYVIIAGVNGAGKTTLFYALEQLQSLPRVNSDEFVNEVDDPRAVIKSGKIAINKINEFMEKEISFNQEATLCGKGIINNIKKAKSKGYSIEMHYVGVDNVNIVKQRVQNRVVSGGHGISAEKIERRYFESLENLKLIFEEIDLLLLYDNTDKLRCFATFESGHRAFIDENIPSWFYQVKDEVMGTRI